MTDFSSRTGGDRGRPGGVPSAAGDHSLLGRRHRLQTAREWLLSGGSVLFFGPVGVGKSAAVDVVAAAAIRSRALRSAPTQSDAGRPYSTLAGLFSSVTSAELEAVPVARGSVIAAVRSGNLESIRMVAVRLAALNLIRVLARSRPLLLIVDDLQWVDEVSADVLRFIAPRIEDLPVAMAASERIAPERLPLCRGLCPPPLLVVRLDVVEARETAPTVTNRTAVAAPDVVD